MGNVGGRLGLQQQDNGGSELVEKEKDKHENNKSLKRRKRSS